MPSRRPQVRILLRAPKHNMKIQVKNPIVELDGDEMARVIWHLIKEELITPYLDLPLEYFDLSITHRDETEDKITLEAAEALKQIKVGVKCATITPDLARLEEFQLKKLYPSPNGTIRNFLDGTVFRAPIVISNIPRLIPTWTKPILIARHAYADQYKARELNVRKGSVVHLTDGESKLLLHEFKSDGVALAMFNEKDSIDQFARSCFKMSLKEHLPLYLSTKNTILKIYDGLFKDRFQEIFEQEYREKFQALNIVYEHKLIDDMVAFALKSSGGFLWACKNYDGDVQSDALAQGFGSLGLMTSYLVNNEVFLSEAAHGTVTRHFRAYQKGEKTSTNSVASIYAWTKALQERARLDAQEELKNFALLLEETVLKTVEKGLMTKDLASVIKKQDFLTTEDFILAIKKNLMWG